MRTGWLKCDVRDGMFSNEVVVTVLTVDGRRASFFVGRELVAADRVKVRIAEGDHEAFVMVPTHPKPILVRREDLVSA